MEYNLNWKESLERDDSIKRLEYRDYEPFTGTNLNKSTDIRISVQNQDEFLLPSRSYIYIEGSLKKEDESTFEKDQPGTGTGAGKELYINLINNGIMYLFSRVDYQLGNENIEGYSNPGQTSTMKGFLTYPINYSEGMNFMWFPDKCDKICPKINNSGYMERHNYLFKNASGNFSVAIPLNHIFGFCENYDKVIYGIKHQLTLRRKEHDNDAILKSSDKDSEGIYKVPDGKIILSKIVWRIPHVTLTDKYMIKLSNDIQNKIVLNVNFLNRQCESVEVNQGQKQFDWRLNVTAGSEKPRFIILAFQENKDDNQVMNPAIFDHCNLTNACVRLNSERYPEMDLQLDFNENHYTTAYKMLSDYFNHILYKEKNCSITLLEYRNLYPLLVFDVSKQSEKLKNSVTDIKITAAFQKNISKPTKAYALVLSERILKLESDGNKMNIVY